MKTVIVLILILIIAIVLGTHFHQVSSSVLINYGSWSIETSLPMAVISLLILFLIFYLIIRLIQETKIWPKRLRLWGRKRKQQKMLELTKLGLIDLMDNKWQKGEINLDRAAKLSPLPVINYLGAAYAASRQQAFDRRDHYLQNLSQTSSLPDLYIHLWQAKFQMMDHQWEQAEINLHQLYQHYPKHSEVIKLLAKVYQHQQNWQQLQVLLPQIQKQGIFLENDYQSLAEQTFKNSLELSANQKNVDGITEVWRQVPHKLHSLLLANYVKGLLKCKQDQQAMILIERFLKQQWYPDLLIFYSKLNNTDINHQLNKAENWLKKYPECPKLLYCLGILCLRSQLWGKAKDYLTSALSLEPSIENHYALAQVNEALKEPMTALYHYRLGINMAIKDCYKLNAKP